MATKIYEEHPVYLIDGTRLLISPLKIKYLHQVMETFASVHAAEDDYESIAIMTECVRLSMQQFYPQLSESIDLVEDSIDLPTIYKILDYAAGIKIDQAKDDTVKDQATESGSTWADLDLLKLESEVFLIGAWSNFDHLEKSICMPELLQLISMRRELDHMEKKFLAAMQGVDIDQDKQEDKWQEMKNRILYGGKDEKDITSLTGRRAAEAGFGIGMGLEYETVSD